MDREAWRAVVYGVAKSRTRLSNELNIPTYVNAYIHIYIFFL